MGDRRNRIARLAKTDRPAARKARTATTKSSSGPANSNRATVTAVGSQSRRTTRSAKQTGSVPEVQGGTPSSAVDDSPPTSVPDNIGEAAGDSQRTTRDTERLDNTKETRSTSVERAASEDGTEAYGMPDVGKSQLATGLDFILDQLEKENLNDEEGLDEEASTEREEEYDDESEEESEPGGCSSPAVAGGWQPS